MERDLGTQQIINSQSTKTQSRSNNKTAKVMELLIQLLKKIATNPKLAGYALVALSSIISKKISMSEESPTTKHTVAEPLFLPRGSVRAVLAFVLLGTSIADFALGSFTLPEEFHAMTIAAVAYYIGYRSDNAKTKEIKI